MHISKQVKSQSVGVQRRSKWETCFVVGNSGKTEIEIRAESREPEARNKSKSSQKLR